MSDELAFPDGDENESFIDQKALQEVILRAEDALRPIGLSLIQESIMMMADPTTGQAVIQFAARLRPKAARKVAEDREAREEFNRMMAQRNQEMIEDKKRRIAEALAAGDPNALFDEPDGCSHERMHPDGFCLDCGKGME